MESRTEKRTTRPTRARAVVGLLWGALVLGGALASGPSCVGKIGTPGAGEDQGAGLVTLALVLPGGSTISEVLWELRAATNATVAAGSIHTDNPSAKLRLAIGAPPGASNTFRMNATTSRGESCAGVSAPFDVVSGRSVDVEVTLLCGNAAGPDGGVGTIIVRGVLVPGDSCPVLTAWSLSPQETAAAADAGVGGAIDLNVAVTDADGEPLTYAWSATAGTFSAPGSASTQYLCGPAGAQTLSVTISDNHQPTACFVSVKFPDVSCVAPGAPSDGG